MLVRGCYNGGVLKNVKATVFEGGSTHAEP